MVWSTWLIWQCRQVCIHPTNEARPNHWSHTKWPNKLPRAVKDVPQGWCGFKKPMAARPMWREVRKQLRLEKREDKFHIASYSNKNNNINKWLIAEKFERLPCIFVDDDGCHDETIPEGFCILPRLVESQRYCQILCLYVVHIDFISCSNSIQFLQLMSDPPVGMDTNTTYW